MNNKTEQINMSSFFEDLSGHYDRFDRSHDFLRSKLLSELKPYGLMSDGSVDNNVRSAGSRISFAGYLSRFAAVAAIVVLAFGLAVFNIDSNSGSSVAVADNVLQKVTEFNNVHFKMTAMNSSMEMWWQRPNNYRMEFSNGTVITNNEVNYSCLDSETGKVSLKPGLEAAGPEAFMLAELGEVFPFDDSPTQSLVKTSEIIGQEDMIFKGEECVKVRSESMLGGDILEYIIDKDQPMIYEISRIRHGKVISHVEVLEIDSDMNESIFSLK